MGVLGVEAPHPGQLVLAAPVDRVAGGGQPGGEVVEVGAEQGDVGLAGGAEVVGDAEVQLGAVPGEPATTAAGEGRGLGFSAMPSSPP